MLPTPTIFRMESAERGRRVLASLDEGPAVRRAPTVRRDVVYLDTFDWRIHRSGGTLSARRAEESQGWILDWSRGSEVRTLQLAELPAFAHELPDSAFREELLSVIEPRRLLSVAELEGEITERGVLDGRSKTVARVELRTGRAAPGELFGLLPGGEGPRSKRRVPPRLAVIPVRGYLEDFRRVAERIESQGADRSGETGELDSILEALGHAAGGYRSRIDVRLDPAWTADRGIRLVLQRLLAAMRANERGTRRDLDPEFLHDFRVAVRRTRTCLGQFKEIVPPGELERYREEFSWLGTVTGPCRDLDVHLMEVDDYCAGLPAQSREPFAPLREFLERQKRDEHRKLDRALDSKRYRSLVSGWDRFLAGTPAGEVPAEGLQPVVRLAAARITRRFRRVIRRGRAIGPDTPAKALHRLRIDCKKLRYLLEFFRSLFDRKDVEPLVGTLKKLQDHLGDLNDISVQEATLASAAGAIHQAGVAGPDTLLAVGRLLERLSHKRAGERKRFGRRFAGFDVKSNLERVARIERAAGGAVS